MTGSEGVAAPWSHCLFQTLAPMVPTSIQASPRLSCTSRVVHMHSLWRSNSSEQRAFENDASQKLDCDRSSCFQPTALLSKFSMRGVGCTAMSGLYRMYTQRDGWAAKGREKLAARHKDPSCKTNSLEFWLQDTKPSDEYCLPRSHKMIPHPLDQFMKLDVSTQQKE